MTEKGQKGLKYGMVANLGWVNSFLNKVFQIDLIHIKNS